MENPIVIGILENAAILIATAVLYDFIWLKSDKSRKFQIQVLLGLLVAGIGIILMKSPWVLVEGIVFDTRSVLLTISGLFFGGVTTVVATVIVAAYRVLMGGDGMYMGVAVIVSSSLISLLWRKVRPGIIANKNLGEVYVVSFLVHLVMLGCTTFLPDENRMATLLVIWWPVILIYPLATALIAKLLFSREENWIQRDKLKESEEKYRLLFENNPNPMWIYELETLRFMEVNTAAIKQYGYSREEFLEMTIKDIRPEEEIPRLIETIQTQNDVYQTSGNWKHRKKNGEIIHVQVASHRITYKGKPAKHVMVSDVSELVKSHKLLSQKEQEFREIFNSGFDSIQIDDIERGKIIDCNDITMEMYGFTKEEIINGSIGDLSANIEPFTEDKAQEYIKKTIKGEPQDFEWLARKKNGETFWVNVRLKLVEIGGVNRVMAIVRDISDRKRTEQNFIESEQRFLRVMHFSKDAIGILDENFHFIDCNDSAARLHGFKSRIELLKNSPHPSALSPQTQPCGSSSYELANKMIEIALEQGFNKFEWLHKKVNGQKFWAEVSLTPIVFNGKRMIYAVWRDISDQKNKQNRIDRLIKILDESINEVYIFRCDNLKFIEFNKTAVNNLGYLPEELLELTALDLKPYLTAEKFNELLKPLNDGTSSKIYFETIHRRKNGTEYPVEVYIEKTKASDIDVYNAIVLDISQRKKYLAELKQREHELREIFDSTLEAILIYDIDTSKIVDCNRQTQTLYGYSKNEIIGKHLGTLSANDEKYNIAEATRWAEKALTVGPQTYTWLGKKKSGETFWVEISLKKSTIGGADRLMAVVRDITERITHQLEIEKREKEFREIFNATAEAILIYDPHVNLIVDCNNRAVEMYGYSSKKEFLNSKLEALGANVKPFTNDRIGYYSQKAAKEGPQRFD